MSRLEPIVTFQAGCLPSILDFKWLEVREGVVRGCVNVVHEHLDNGRTIGLFRCTQMLLYPVSGGQT